MDGHGVPEVSSRTTGVHLSWSGPPAWLHAPEGFTVQRRVAARRVADLCEVFDAARLARLAEVLEQPLSFGTVTLRRLGDDGGEVVIAPGAVPVLLGFDLEQPHRTVRVAVEAAVSLAIGYVDHRAVAVGGPSPDAVQHLLRAPRIDRVEVLVVRPERVMVCVDQPSDDDSWRDATTVVTGLTLPLAELRPDLASPADELAEARARLLPDERIGEEEFRRLTAVLRPVTRAAPLPPAETTLLLEGPDGDAEQIPDEVSGLDPLRTASVHPTWRRALGLGLLDDDPELVPGETYDYRISGTWPATYLRDPRYGFTTVPSGTMLPPDFFLGDLRLRLPRPTAVALAPGTATTGAVRLSRRGIALDPTRESFWRHASLEDWSLVLDFPEPVSEIELDLAEGHDLVAAAGPAAGLFDLTFPVPAGTAPRLVLPAASEQLRLRGTGFLHGLRVVTTSEEKVEVAVELAPITLQDTPLPGAPRTAAAVNLQSPVPATQRPAGEVAARHALGFRVAWQPALAFGLPGWFAPLAAAAPLEATTFQVERRSEPDGDWVPVHDDENRTLGERGGAMRAVALAPGTDLMEVFPDSAVRTTGADTEVSVRDTFATSDEVPEPGTLHRYRVRAVDAVGRPGTEWRETGPVRLEKRRPPPVPSGVEARVLVRDAEDLTEAERVLLGTSGTAIVLRWGWTDEQRAEDPFATEFRVYVARPLDRITGVLPSGTSLSGGDRPRVYRVSLTLDRPIPENRAVGGHLDAGHPFLIRSHTAGTSIEMVVETRLRRRDGTVPSPVAGPVVLAVPIDPDRTRPDSWDERVEVRPVGPERSYETVLRDRLLVDEDNPVDQLWVGVSAADDQPYVPDQRGPTETRPGNESAIVAAQARGRYAGRPTLELPAPLEPVPELLTPEPGAEPLHFPLDLTPHLPAAATATGRVRVERVSAATLVSALAVTADGRVLALPVEPTGPGDEQVEVTPANPDDRDLLVAALRSGRTTEVPDRFLVHLAGRHAYRDRLFVPAREDPVPPGPAAETLPPAAERWLYRVRAVDRAGRVSAGSATARVVVRVPSLLPGAAPRRDPAGPDDPPGLLRVRVPADPTLTHLLVFSEPARGTGPLPGPVGGAAVSRVPNRPDLLPTGGIRLRSPDSGLLVPTALALDGPEVSTDPDGARRLAVTVPGGPGARTRVWLATLTRDGVSSVPAGPVTVELPPPPLPVPALSVAGPGPRFGWQWPGGAEPAASLRVSLERTGDGLTWERVSPMLDPLGDGVTAARQPAGSWQYRLRVSAPDGRATHSDPVTVS